MENLKYLEVTPRTLSQFVENLDILKQRFEDRTQCVTFLNRFPFDQLLNRAVADDFNLPLSVKILDFLMDYEEFYISDTRINNSLEFVLLSLTQITVDCSQINVFLNLLSKLVWGHRKTIDDSTRNILDSERILTILLKVADFQTVYESHFIFFSPIVNRLLDVDFPDSLHYIICELFQKFKEHNVLREQANICRIILRRKSKFLCESLTNIWKWVSEDCPSILLQCFNCNDEKLLEDLIYCVLTFEANWKTLSSVDKSRSCKMSDFSKNVYMKLNIISSDICLKTSNLRLRHICMRLLQFLLNEFFVEELMQCSKDIFTQIEKFDKDVAHWPSANQDIFFCICHLCLRYSRLLWKKSEVFQAMKVYFNSRRHIIKRCTLKSIFFLYPALLDGEVNFCIRTLGDKLLNYFEQICTLPELYSYDINQLKWILSMAHRSLKLIVLCQWLTKSQSNEIYEQLLIEAIKMSNAETTLLHLILDDVLGKKFGSKAALILRKFQNPQISRCICHILHKTVRKPICFYNLLLVEPMPDLDLDKAVFLCVLMGAVIPTFIDNEILKHACKFTTKLLGHNKGNKTVIEKFCFNEVSIHHLVRFIHKTEDDTAVEIIRLLKLAVLLAHRHKLKPKYAINDELSSIIRGSHEKVEIGLRFLYHTLAIKHSLIALDSGHVLETYQLVLDCALNPLLQFSAYECTILLLKREPSLAQTISTRIHIEMACLSLSDSSNNQSLLKMLDTWLTVIRKEPYNGFCPIPGAAIKSFIRRLNMNPRQLGSYIQTIDYLLKREREQVKNRRNIFYTNI